MKNTLCSTLVMLFILVSHASLVGQSVEVDADLKVSGGLNFSGFSVYDQDTFTIDLPGITFANGKVPQGTIVSFVSSASNMGESFLSVDNGSQVSPPQPIVQRGVILLQPNDIVAGEIVLAIFDTSSVHLLSGLDIPNYLTQCGDQLVDLQSDEAHCGDCNITCPPGHLCVDGNCVLSCQNGLTTCSGTCVNTQTDRNNCGDCGIVCAPGEVCSGGNCVLSCQTGLTDCSGICTNTQTDRNNCGDCGTVCNAGEICSGGNCQISCPPNLTDCGGTCVDTQTDENNCNGCGITCPPGQYCVDGTCITP